MLADFNQAPIWRQAPMELPYARDGGKAPQGFNTYTAVGAFFNSVQHLQYTDALE